MTDLQWLLSGLLVLVIALDLFSIAGINGLLNTNRVRLAALQAGLEDKSQKILQMTEPGNYRRANASVQIASGVLRFLAAGLALLILQTWLIAETSAWITGIKIAGILIAAAILFAWLERVSLQSATLHPEIWALRGYPLLRVWMFVFYPLTTLGTLLYSGSLDPSAGSVTEAELKSLVDAGQVNGVLEQEERKMIYSIFQLGDTLAREIMIPRIDITALDVQTPFEPAVDDLLKSGYSRVPVYEESIDTVLGLLYTKDLLRVWRQHDQVKSLRDLLRPAYFIPEAKKVDELLAEMQSQRIHMAVVVDEYGGVAGLVTLEDIVEEIVGEIQDEFDQAEELPYQELGDGEYLFQGKIGLDDFNEIMGSSLPSDEAETLGGLIYNRIGRVPTSGESIQVEDILLTVAQVSGRRIRKIRAKWNPVTTETREEKTNVD